MKIFAIYSIHNGNDVYLGKTPILEQAHRALKGYRDCGIQAYMIEFDDDRTFDHRLLRYIPGEYKTEVVAITLGEKAYNERTHRWNQMILVEWADGEICEYQNATYMGSKLKEFGR